MSNESLHELVAKVDPDVLEAAIAAHLSNRVRSGNTSSMPALLQLLDHIRDRKARAHHQEKMQELTHEPALLCRYLAELGETESGAVMFLGRELTEQETSAFRLGQRSRALEMRAITLSRARAGGGQVEPWMLR